MNKYQIATLRLRSGLMVSVLRLRSGLVLSLSKHGVEPSNINPSATLRIDGERPSTSLRTSAEFIEARSRTIKNQKLKSKAKNALFLRVSLIFAIFILSFTLNCYAKEITIIFTGDTHAMLYPCNCHLQPDGGIARRGTLVKQLRKNYPQALLLDSGAFFAGGLMDEYTLNTQLDSERSLVNLKAMELMKYDAVGIGDDEFNFGAEFFQENIKKINLKFLSCNLEAKNVLPYIIKEVSGVKIGIIGVTGLSAMQKAEGLKFTEPKIAVTSTIGKLKKEGANVIVLLSQLGENEDSNLINDAKGIDILISGRGRNSQESSTKIADTLLLRPSWQGRRLGKLSFSVKDNKVINYKVEELRLSNDISDDQGIISILPRCFSDANCKKEGLIGSCQDAGSIRSRCLFSEATKIKLVVISSKSCVTCDTERVVSYLKRQFPGVVATYYYYPESKKAVSLMNDLGVKTLPVYLLGKEVEKEKNFDSIKVNLTMKADLYILNPELSGISFFPLRKKIKGRLDLFISLHDKKLKELLGVVKEFNPVIHFLAVEKEDSFEAAKGNFEVEDYLRAVCVQKYYPQYFWDYISCRAGSVNSSWWEDCAVNMDASKIKSCARSSQGNLLLKENIALNKETQVMFGPTYLLNNQEIFSSVGVPNRDELKKIIER